ncbi:protein ydgH precursor [Plautia stali symbiont]|nr:protein ydgH precursor [Plautia stali symbiont]
MKLKNTILASTLLSLLAANAFAAKELTPEQAAALKPFERINISGRFNAIGDATDAVSKAADAKGADSFYVQGINDSNGNGGNWRVTADLYKTNAPKVEQSTQYRMFNGVKELPKAEAYRLEPFDTVSVSGFFSNQPDVNEAIAKAAKNKGAASFFIVRQVDANNGGNQYVTAYVYKADAKARVVHDTSDSIPADSEASKAALAAGGAAAKKVAIPGVASSDTPSTSVGRFFETQSSTGQRYTVTQPDGHSVQEVNAITAAQMQPFDTISFSDHFGTPTEISEAVGKRAIAKGAKYYHITRQWQNQSGGNLTVTADLFK